MGECFRDGPSETRLRDTARGVQGQLEASASHKKLISRLRTLNYHIDVVINTCSTDHDTILLDYYDPVVVKNFAKTPYRSLNHALRSSIACAPYMNDYDFLFLCRLDILLKDPVIEAFDPSWQTITFPNVMYIDEGATYPHIANLFCFVPKKYFSPFDAWEGIAMNTDNLLGHHTVEGMLQGGLTLADIGFFTDKLYIANTAQMSNPLYAINCRPEGPSYVKGFSDLTYKKDRHCVVDSSGVRYVCRGGVIVKE